MAVDEGHGLISPSQADFADRRGSVLLPSIVDPLCTRLAAHGLLVREVATVESHRQNLLEKAGVRNTAALVKYAMDHSLLQP